MSILLWFSFLSSHPKWIISSEVLSKVHHKRKSSCFRPNRWKYLSFNWTLAIMLLLATFKTMCQTYTKNLFSNISHFTDHLSIRTISNNLKSKKRVLFHKYFTKSTFNLSIYSPVSTLIFVFAAESMTMINHSSSEQQYHI